MPQNDKKLNTIVAEKEQCIFLRKSRRIKATLCKYQIISESY